MKWDLNEGGVNLDASTPPVEGNCDYTGMQLPAEINVSLQYVQLAFMLEKLPTKEENSLRRRSQDRKSMNLLTRNGITTKSHGPSSGSFVLMSISEFQRSRYAQTSIQLPKTGVNLDASTPPVEGNCDYTGMQLPAEINVIVCPPDCLKQKEKVWGKTSFAERSRYAQTSIQLPKTEGFEWDVNSVEGVNLDASTPPVEGNCDYTGMQLPAEINESSVCAAGIHAGKITNQGGKLIAQKKPGQEKYESSHKKWNNNKKSWTIIWVICSHVHKSLQYVQLAFMLEKLPTEEEN
ncbi:unnamed protein product [Ranitomeya imitator]|uniref:LCCL domain-containing protein n=1 Tax=Ranitomeya imitator TaxID=111125 RepID=A0ABN9KPT0_9NEOB|nr:unnamed protein product [Ranitomeya imitator]